MLHARVLVRHEVKKIQPQGQPEISSQDSHVVLRRAVRGRRRWDRRPCHSRTRITKRVGKLVAIEAHLVLPVPAHPHEQAVPRGWSARDGSKLASAKGECVTGRVASDEQGPDARRNVTSVRAALRSLTVGILGVRWGRSGGTPPPPPPTPEAAARLFRNPGSRNISLLVPPRARLTSVGMPKPCVAWSALAKAQTRSQKLAAFAARISSA